MEHTSHTDTPKVVLYIRETEDVSWYKPDAFWNGLSRVADVKQNHKDALLVQSTAKAPPIMRTVSFGDLWEPICGSQR